MISAFSCRRDLKQSHSMRTNRRPIAIMRRSCSDSPVTASQLDAVFGSDNRQLPATALDETCAFQLSGRICDGRPLDAQHLCKNILGDRQFVSITAVAHHKEPCASRCVRLWAPLHAPETMTCSRKAWT